MLSLTLSDDLRAARLPAFASAWEAWAADPKHADLDAESCLRFLLDAHRHSQNQSKVDAFFREARLATHFALCTFEGGRTVGLEAHRLAHLRNMSWARLGQTVVLTGPTLSGKTHLAAALGREAVAQGFRVAMVQVPRLLDRLLDPDLPTKERKRYFRTLSRVHLLILDDFATEPAGSERTMQLRRLLQERADLKLPLVVTSIRAVDEWDDAFEEEATREGIYGRVLGGACHQVALNRRVRSTHATRASTGGATKRKGALPTRS
jgi:DNA replication protein DnaC